MRLARASASYPEGNFGGNQLLDGSFGLSPLYPAPTIDLHVRTAADLHRVFPGFVLARHRSPSFGSRRVRSGCVHVLDRTAPAPRMRRLRAARRPRPGSENPPRLSTGPARGPDLPSARTKARPSLSLRLRVSTISRGLAHVLDSLARVSRRGGWTAELARRYSDACLGRWARRPDREGLYARLPAGIKTPTRRNSGGPCRHDVRLREVAAAPRETASHPHLENRP